MRTEREYCLKSYVQYYRGIQFCIVGLIAGVCLMVVAEEEKISAERVEAVAAMLSSESMKKPATDAPSPR